MKEKPELLTRAAWAKRVGKLPPGDVLPEVPGLVKYCDTTVELKEVDPATGMRDIAIVISTAVQDRDDDIITVDGWEIDNYLKNPVVLYGHNYRGLPIAQALEIGVTDGKLMALDRFTPADVNPFGYTVYRLVEGGFIRAASVGFRPIKYLWNDDHKGYDFEQQELLEHSFVPVPSNPEALVAAAAGGIDLAPMREWAEKLLDDPESDRVALWLPRETLEAVRKAAGAVAPTQVETSTPDDSKPPAKGTEEPTPGDDQPDKLNDEQEALMKKAIEALTEVVSHLQAVLEKLPDAIAEKVAAVTLEVIKKPGDESDAPDGDELTEDEVKAIVRAATEEVITATSGKLPE